jgi:lactate permease
MSSQALWASLPIFAMLMALTCGLTSVLGAGCIGLLIAFLEATAGYLPHPLAPMPALMEVTKGAWVAWQFAIVVAAGFFFYSAVRHVDRTAGLTQSDLSFSHRRLWLICFLLGPIAESATGVGVGAIIALPAILKLGLSGTSAIILSLYSQILVPWGALGVGTIVGATLAHLPVNTLSFATALLTAPLLLGYLMLFWWFTHLSGHCATARQRFDDLVWTCALALTLAIVTWFAPVELGVIIAAGLVLCVRWWRDERPSLRPALVRLATLRPYIMLIAGLLLTRTIPPLRRALEGTLSVRPFVNFPAYAPLYNPSALLIACGLITFTLSNRSGQILPALVETILRTWRPIAITVVFLAMAQVLAGAGAAAVIGLWLKESLGGVAELVTPLIGGLGGFLVGSNAASTGMFMPIQVSLGIDNSLWQAAVQNASASNFTLLSPVRVGMAVALAGLTGGERVVYAKIWPIAAMLLTVLTIEAGFVLYLS